MATTLFLTDERADIAGYYRLKLSARSDAPSLVRAVTATQAGPTTGIPITRTATGTAISWISDPLDGTDLTANPWTFHMWAAESDAAANVALRFQLLPFTTAEGTAALDDSATAELPTTTQDYARTSPNATATVMNDRDRLVLKILLIDAGTMATGYSATISYNGQFPGAEGDSWITSASDTLAVTAQIPTATVSAVRAWLKDTDPTRPFITTAEIQQGITRAIDEYSRDRPRAIAEYYSGDSQTFDFPLPRFFVRGFSQIYEVEYPANNQVRTVVDTDDWLIIEKPSTTTNIPIRALRLISTPGRGTDNIIVRYSAPQVHTDELDTIPIRDFQAFCQLGGSFAAQMAAGRMAASADSTIGADVVNYRDGVQRWSDVARQLRKGYDDHIGAGEDTPPAQFTQDWDTVSSWGTDRLLHRRRWR